MRRALAEHGDDAQILAGGQSLVPLMNLRLARPEVVVSINRCHVLDYIRLADDRLVIGALVRQIDAETSPLVQAECPLLAKALPSRLSGNHGCGRGGPQRGRPDR